MCKVHALFLLIIFFLGCQTPRSSENENRPTSKLIVEFPLGCDSGSIYKVNGDLISEKELKTTILLLKWLHSTKLPREGNSSVITTAWSTDLPQAGDIDTEIRDILMDESFLGKDLVKNILEFEKAKYKFEKFQTFDGPQYDNNPDVKNFEKAGKDLVKALSERFHIGREDWPEVDCN